MTKFTLYANKTEIATSFTPGVMDDMKNKLEAEGMPAGVLMVGEYQPGY